MTFKQEYAVKSYGTRYSTPKRNQHPRELIGEQLKKMETLNQFVARHTYDELLNGLSGKVTRKAQILDEGYGYQVWVKDFRKELAEAGISEALALKELTPVLMQDYHKIALEMLKFKVRHSK